jgi:excisionase family DNA binding protein
MNEEKLMLSVNEAAKYLGIGRTLAYQLSRSEGFPILTIGKRVLVPIEGLKAWVNKKVEEGGEL